MDSSERLRWRLPPWLQEDCELALPPIPGLPKNPMYSEWPDVSGNARVVTFDGMTWALGPIGHEGVLDGTDDHADSTFTKNITGTLLIVAKRHTSAADQILLDATTGGGTGSLLWDQSAGLLVASSGTIYVGKSKTSVMRQGEYEAIIVSGIALNFTKLVIGDAAAGGAPFDGNLLAVCLWSSTFSERKAKDTVDWIAQGRRLI